MCNILGLQRGKLLQQFAEVRCVEVKNALLLYIYSEIFQHVIYNIKLTQTFKNKTFLSNTYRKKSVQNSTNKSNQLTFSDAA